MKIFWAMKVSWNQAIYRYLLILIEIEILLWRCHLLLLWRRHNSLMNEENRRIVVSKHFNMVIFGPKSIPINWCPFVHWMSLYNISGKWYSYLTADFSQLCSRLAVFRGEFWSFRYFKDTDPRETQKLKQNIKTKICSQLLDCLIIYSGWLQEEVLFTVKCHLVKPKRMVFSYGWIWLKNIRWQNLNIKNSKTKIYPGLKKMVLLSK